LTIFPPGTEIWTPSEIVQNLDEYLETPADITPPAADITPIERGGLLPETAQTPLESEPAPPPAAGMPPLFDLAPAATDLPPALVEPQPEAGRLTVELCECTPAALDLTPASSDLALVSIDVDPRACSRVHDRRFPTPVKARPIETAIRQTLFEGPEIVQTGHDSPPFLGPHHLDGSARQKPQTFATARKRASCAHVWGRASGFGDIRAAEARRTSNARRLSA
jgi:hypothetical protein